jgi:hypothetical protein
VSPAPLRILSGEVTGLKDSWFRRPVFARWVHNVVIVYRGLALARTNALGVAEASGPLTASESGEIQGVGPEPFTLTLVLDSGASLDLAAGATPGTRWSALRCRFARRGERLGTSWPFGE